MTSSPNSDPVDVAASYPEAPEPSSGASGVVAPVPAEVIARLDGTAKGAAEVVLSAEKLTAGTEWTVTGAVRFRRRIATYTRTVEVTVRREELQVEVRDVVDRGGVWVGTDYRGPAVAVPSAVTRPGVFVLREEVPDVAVTVRPYERVIVNIDRVTEQVQLHDTRLREQAVVSGDTGVTHPASRP